MTGSAFVMVVCIVAMVGLDWWHRRWYRAASKLWIDSNDRTIASNREVREKLDEMLALQRGVSMRRPGEERARA